MARTLPARSRRLPRLPPEGGDPPKTERPESFPADRPIDHHVAGHKAEHPDKPGRPRNDRNHTTPQPLAPDLTKAPVQISDSEDDSRMRKLRARWRTRFVPPGEPQQSAWNAKSLQFQAPRAGFEPAAYSLGGRPSIGMTTSFPTRKSLQIGSFSKGHEKSRRSTSYQLLFPLCSHLRGVRCDGSAARASAHRSRIHPLRVMTQHP